LGGQLTTEDRPPSFLTVSRAVVFLCLVAFALYLAQSGEGRAMARSLVAEGQFNKALADLGNGRITQASSRLEAADEASTRHRMQLRVGIVYSLDGMLNEALPHLAAAVSSNPKDAGAYYYLGDCLLKMNRLPEGRQAFQRALALRPRDPVLMNNVGYSYADKGVQLEEAEQLISQAVAMRPNQGFIIDSLGWLYFRQGKLTQALEYLQRAHRLSPGNPEVAAHLAQVRQALYSEGSLSPSK